MSETSWKTPNAVIGIIGTLVAAGGLYLGYLQFIKPPEGSGNPSKTENQTEDPVVVKNAKRIAELEKELQSIDSRIATYQERKNNMNAENSFLYQDEDESTMATEDLRKLMKQRANAERDLNEVNKIIQELQGKRDKVQNKLDAIGN